MDGFLGSMPIASLLGSTRSLFLRATFARNITTMEQVRIDISEVEKWIAEKIDF